MEGRVSGLTWARALMRRLAAPGADWRSPATAPRTVMVALFAVSGVFAAGVTVVSNNDLHRLWGVSAACAYLAAALAAVVWRSRRGMDLALLASLGGALVMPLSLLASDRLRQPEVTVIQRSATMLVHHGGLYLSPAVLASTHNPNLFDPYLPLMTGFGLPHALLGVSPLTDPRIWFGAAFAAMFAAALAVTGVSDVARWTALVAASPVIAFSLTVGGTDIPVFAAQCLGFALLWRSGRPALAGAAFGAAAAMKATAWPALVVAVVLVAARDGRSAAARLLAAAVVVAAALVGPVAAVWPKALVQNTIEFPLGLAHVQSAAASPLPGRLLAQTGAAGHTLAMALLVLAGLGITASLLVRPPRTVAAAAWRLILGLSLMFLLAPSTRFGYFLYPLGLLAWLGICRRARHAHAGEPAAGVPAAAVTGGGPPVPVGAP